MVRIRVKKPGSYYFEEIGDLDFKTNIPTPKKAKCACCGDKIETGSVTIGVKKDHPLYMFHPENCLDQGTLFPEGDPDKKKRGKGTKKKTAKRATKKKATKKKTTRPAGTKDPKALKKVVKKVADSFNPKNKRGRPGRPARRGMIKV